MKARLLIVDDEAPIREMLDRHFRFLGYEVATAADGVEALEQMARTRADVVISDIRMPRMAGTDLLSRLSDEYPMTRVVMITGYVTQEHVLACMRRHADACLCKPLEDLHELEIVVAQAVDRLNRWMRTLSQLHKLKPAEALIDHA